MIGKVIIGARRVGVDVRWVGGTQENGHLRTARGRVFPVGVLPGRHKRKDAAHAGSFGRKGKVDVPVEIVLLDVREDLAVYRPAGKHRAAGAGGSVIRNFFRRESFEGGMVNVEGPT